jgi:hypothetical protein
VAGLTEESSPVSDRADGHGHSCDH